MNKIIKLLISGLLLSILFTGCAKSNPATQAMNSKNVEKPVPVMVETATLADLEEYISFTAKLEGITDIYLTSESSGKVMELKKQLGDWIEKGEAIGSIENDSYQNMLIQARASLLSAEASVELAELQMETSEKLFMEARISRSEYISAQSSYKQAQAARENARVALKQSELNVKNAQFTAPVSGYISDLKLEIGSYIGIGQQVCRIVDNRKLVIKTGLSEADIFGIKKGQKVNIISDHSEIPVNGKITGIGIAPINGSIHYPVEIELENPGKSLLPGMVVSGNILRKTYEKVLYTSINNLTQIYDEYLLYTINDENRAEQHKVKLGSQIERNVIIISGINPGDRVVIEGASSLNNNSLVEIKN
ncbi:MAG: efflux RND transporter periplasmic adaptor subunit [Candidatus Cloacimonetes bacterium]|nr:efflux RND transporter periplasmic adaptor subunit [Candidatus Cloacimonadota bacterium]